MIHSMTGFGRGEYSENGFSVTVELKSLNSRYCDISVRLPQVLQDKESAIREIIQEQFTRGKFNISIRLSQDGMGEPDITFNENVAKGYYRLLQSLADTVGIEQQVTLDHLLEFNNLFTNKEQDDEEVEQWWSVAEKALERAMNQLNKMRRNEGTQLEDDLNKRLQQIDENLESIKTLTKERVPEERRKLHERVTELIEDDTLDEERLEMEIAIIADKIDITEEIVRLQSHIKFFEEALDQDGAMGRRLNFLLQEMNREANTIGSKANSSEISHQVVQVKENLEKIREQVQNVE